jgi:hypothetical protein
VCIEAVNFENLLLLVYLFQILVHFSLILNLISLTLLTKFTAMHQYP